MSRPPAKAWPTAGHLRPPWGAIMTGPAPKLGTFKWDHHRQHHHHHHHNSPWSAMVVYIYMYGIYIYNIYMFNHHDPTPGPTPPWGVGRACCLVWVIPKPAWEGWAVSVKLVWHPSQSGEVRKHDICGMCVTATIETLGVPSGKLIVCYGKSPFCRTGSTFPNSIGQLKSSSNLGWEANTSQFQSQTNQDRF